MEENIPLSLKFLKGTVAEPQSEPPNSKSKTKTGKPKAKKPVKEFEVRPGTAAVCAGWMKNDLVAGRLFHGFLELWVDTKKKIIRTHEGEPKEFLFLSSDHLRTLTGLSKWQLQKAITIMKGSSFFVIKTGRVAPDAPNRYQIHFDAKGFWAEVEDELKIVTGVTELVGGFKVANKEIDRKALPYLFKRLLDVVSDEE